MRSLENQLGEWRDAGLLDEGAADRIAQYERRRRRPRSAQPVLIELFAYLGLVIVSAGVVLLVAVNWDRLASLSRVAALAVPGIVMLPAGRFLATASGPGGLRRGGSVSWLASLTLLVGALTVAGYEFGADPESTLLVAGTSGLLLAPALWLLVREHAQLVGLAAAAVLFSAGLAAFNARYLGDSMTVMLGGGAMIVLFAAGAAMVRRGFLGPMPTAGVLSLLGLASGGVVFAVGLAGQFEGAGVPLSTGLVLMGLGLWGIVMARLGLLLPRLLAGMLSEAGVAVATVLLAVGLAQRVAPGKAEATPRASDAQRCARRWTTVTAKVRPGIRCSSRKSRASTAASWMDGRSKSQKTLRAMSGSRR